MIAACRKAKVKLMIAYRLHFEGLNLAAIDIARNGQLGALKFFNSSFAMTVRRRRHSYEAGVRGRHAL